MPLAYSGMKAVRAERFLYYYILNAEVCAACCVRFAAYIETRSCQVDDLTST